MNSALFPVGRRWTRRCRVGRCHLPRVASIPGTAISCCHRSGRWSVLSLRGRPRWSRGWIGGGRHPRSSSTNASSVIAHRSRFHSLVVAHRLGEAALSQCPSQMPLRRSVCTCPWSADLILVCGTGAPVRVSVHRFVANCLRADIHRSLRVPRTSSAGECSSVSVSRRCLRAGAPRAGGRSSPMNSALSHVGPRWSRGRFSVSVASSPDAAPAARPGLFSFR